MFAALARNASGRLGPGWAALPSRILVALAATARTEKGSSFRLVRLPARHAIRQGGLGGGERHRDHRALPALAEEEVLPKRFASSSPPTSPKMACFR